MHRKELHDVHLVARVHPALPVRLELRLKERRRFRDKKPTAFHCGAAVSWKKGAVSETRNPPPLLAAPPPTCRTLCRLACCSISSAVLLCRSRLKLEDELVLRSPAEHVSAHSCSRDSPQGWRLQATAHLRSPPPESSSDCCRRSAPPLPAAASSASSASLWATICSQAQAVSLAARAAKTQRQKAVAQPRRRWCHNGWGLELRAVPR